MGTRKKGFTLIELLVVMAIIAILAAILFPLFNAAKRRAKMVQCVNNCKQLGFAFNSYIADYGRMPRAGKRDGKGDPRYYGGRGPNWCGARGEENGGWVDIEKGQIWPYIRNRSVFLCPEDYKRPASRAYVDSNRIPEPYTLKDYPLSYSMNITLDTQITDSLAIHRSKCMLIIHENREIINDGIFEPGGRDEPDVVHYTGTVVAYVDGHARWAPYDALVKEEKYWVADSKKYQW